MQFDKPVRVYTARTNIDAQLIAAVLNAQGIEAFAEEDRSGASLWMLGTITQFHKPEIWVDGPNAVAATTLIQEFEQHDRDRREVVTSSDEANYDVRCDACGSITQFPVSQIGTVQNCSKCGEYLDVGEPDDVEWEGEKDDFETDDEA